MVAGLFGPAWWSLGSPTSAASADGAAGVSAATFQPDDAMEDDGWGVEDGEEGVYRAPEAEVVIHHPMYRPLFGNVFLEDAVLRMFCQAAKLNNLLFGDNQANPEVLSDMDVEEIATAAEVLGNYIQVLLGPVATTKLHRLMRHLAMELRNRGNLWEGDTSENEARHASIKQMFKRTNKHGVDLLLQMLRAEETQSEVLEQMERDERQETRHATWARPAGADDQADGEDEELTECLQTHRRGVAVTVASVAERPGLASLPAALGVGGGVSIVVANTVNLWATFEWGAEGVKQHVRGCDSFRGAPWYSCIRFRGVDGETRWGLVRVVIREVAGYARPCVVVQCYQRAPARRVCVLSEFGCQRLCWDFACPADEWPRVEVVELASVLRLEQIHPDWVDLVGRHGVGAMPSNVPKTADERRRAHFFTNVFYPWTSRALRVIL